MANNNKKKMLFTTPKGTAIYPWLNRADFQFDTAGQFKVNLRISQDDAKELMGNVQDAANDAFGAKAKTAKMPWKVEPETGDVLFITKSKFKPRLVDSTGQVIPESNEPQVNSGSTIKCAGTIFPYSAGGNIGISLQLAGVQLIELAERGETSLGFGAEEGGFVAAAENDNISNNDGNGDASYNF
jgi:hypothetical protein